MVYSFLQGLLFLLFLTALQNGKTLGTAANKNVQLVVHYHIPPTEVYDKQNLSAMCSAPENSSVTSLSWVLENATEQIRQFPKGSNEVSMLKGKPVRSNLNLPIVYDLNNSRIVCYAGRVPAQSLCLPENTNCAASEELTVIDKNMMPELIMPTLLVPLVPRQNIIAVCYATLGTKGKLTWVMGKPKAGIFKKIRPGNSVDDSLSLVTNQRNGNRVERAMTSILNLTVLAVDNGFSVLCVTYLKEKNKMPDFGSDDTLFVASDVLLFQSKEKKNDTEKVDDNVEKQNRTIKNEDKDEELYPVQHQAKSGFTSLFLGIIGILGGVVLLTCIGSKFTKENESYAASNEVNTGADAQTLKERNRFMTMDGTEQAANRGQRVRYGPEDKLPTVDEEKRETSSTTSTQPTTSTSNVINFKSSSTISTKRSAVIGEQAISTPV